MDKSGYNRFNYPQMPPEMNQHEGVAGGSGEGAHNLQMAPPSYDQATTAPHMGFHAPVQVLPMPVHPENLIQNNPSGQGYGATTGMPQAQPKYTYPTQQGMPGPGQQPQVVIIQQQAILPLGPEPVYLKCPACHAERLTRIDYEPSSKTHLMAGLLCLLGLWCCVCLPYCSETCMTTNHYCGNCNKFLGSYGNNF